MIKKQPQTAESLVLEPLTEKIDLDNVLTEGNGEPLVILIEGNAPDIGIFDGDLVIVDKSKLPEENDLIFARSNGNISIKYHTPDKQRGLRLITNELLKKPVDNYEVFGVITFIIKRIGGTK